MQVTFWGTRGSIATPGVGTLTYGGNTSCVEIRCGTDIFIFDAGTGIRPLGLALAQEFKDRPVTLHLFISHTHWDHIQGFPFFTPAYIKGNRIEIYGPERAAGRDVRAALDAQMRAPHFPVGLDAMRAELGFHPLPAGAEFRISPIQVRAAAANHPGGCLAYRLESGGRSVVYATDTEHGEEVDSGLLELARDCDVLIYDAQYTAEEYPQKRGWGHSTPEEAVRLARAAGAGQLVLFHHDPGHGDEAIAKMEQSARALFPTASAAREGLEIVLAPRRARSAA
jgi:phosphoribosyl 1,2-cyclic phosphodiesterase